MSYGANYSQYSPYYQQPGTGQDGQRAGSTYQTNSYQPISTFQTHGTTSATSSYDGHRYGSASSAANVPIYKARTGHANGRSSVDSTSLGNLGYASSLGRAFTSSHQHNAYDSSNHYRSDAAASTSVVHSQVDSEGATGTSKVNSSKSPVASQAQYATYQPNSVGGFSYPSQAYSRNTGRNSPAPPPNATPQASQQPSLRYKPKQTAFQPVHQAKRHSVHSTESRATPASNHSSGLGSLHDTSSRLNSQQEKEEQSSTHNRQHRPNSPASSNLPGSHASARPQQLQLGRLQGEKIDVTGQPQKGDKPHGVRSLDNMVGLSDGYRQSPSVQSSQQTTPVQGHHPMTVDPSQVFNDYEYQRRKDEELAKRGAEKVPRVAQSTPQGNNPSYAAHRSVDERSHSVSSQPSDVLQAAKAAIGNPFETDTSRKDQMELEMKQMIEKMRDYKAKDPGLFSQIWEQVKKGQAPQATSASKPNAQTTSAPTLAANSQLASPVQSELPAESELPAASPFPPNSGRGRFPYQRRSRGGMHAPRFKDIKSDQKEVRVSQRPAATSPTTTAPVSHTASTGNDSTDRRLSTAMQTFQNSLNNPSPTPGIKRPSPPPQPVTKAQETDRELAKPSATSAGSGEPKPPIGKTQWPEQKKRALAEAAMIHLRTEPPNVGKLITANDIHGLLDKGPSYVQMCNYLEERGFVIDRTNLARFLLSAVPEIAAPIQTVSKMKSATPVPTHLIPSGAPQIPTASYAAPPPRLSGQTQSRSGVQNLLGNLFKQSSQTASVSGKVVNGLEIPKQPITKENKARKRNFGDIVDLTQAMSDDEDFQRHQPKSKTDTPADSHAIDSAKSVIDGTGSPAPSVGHGDRQVETSFSPTGREHILKEAVVEPINKRRDARRCSSYDPKTIARDILISSGKHPTMAPLNYHLEILRERFEHVNNNSDLSTFRWDIVDPAEMSAKKHTTPASLADIMGQSAGGGAEGDIAANKLDSRAEKKATIKRRDRPRKCSNPAISDPYESEKGRSGLHTFNLPPESQDTTRKETITTDQPKIPHIRPNPVLIKQRDRAALIKSFEFTPVATSTTPPNAAGSNSFLPPFPLHTRSPFRRCLRCKKQYGVCDGQQPCSRCRQAGISPKECVIVRDEIETWPSSAQPTKSMSPRRANTLSSPIPPPLADAPSQQKKVVHGRKGRPPGSKNKQPRADKGVPKDLNKALPQITKPVPRPLPRDSTPRRSSGLVNATSPTHSIAVVIQSRSPSVAGSGSRHKGKIEVKVDDGARRYKTYKCGWERCPAELHNLETLRKHVRKHRNGLNGIFPCKWAGCGNSLPEAATREWLTYGNENWWDTHIETKHIRAVAKAQGDASDEESSDQSLEDELSH